MLAGGGKSAALIRCCGLIVLAASASLFPPAALAQELWPLLGDLELELSPNDLLWLSLFTA